MKHRYSKRENGSALVLAILVMFSMWASALLRCVLSDGLVSAGNLRITKQVRQVAEMGLYREYAYEPQLELASAR